MTLEELFYVKPTRATQGRPAANLTDKKMARRICRYEIIHNAI